MDIYRLINSADIAQHCKAINHTFNSLEAAFISFNSDTLTVEERHAAYTEIIETMPDLSICDNSRESLNAQWSLHWLLKKYIEIENQLQELFCEETEKTAYQYSCLVSYDDSDEWLEEKVLYDSYPAAVKAIQSENSSRDPEDRVKRCCLTKKWLNADRFIRAMITPDGKILEYYSQDVLDREEQRLHNSLFRNMWIKIPTPFQKGDIVIGTADGKAWSSKYNQRPFVLEKICYWQTDDNKKEAVGHDAADMTAYGYWIDEHGCLEYDCMHSYQNLEYYRGALKGNQRILTAVSSHMKGEIDYALLLNACETIRQEKYAEESRRMLSYYTKEGLALTGIKPDGK